MIIEDWVMFLRRYPLKELRRRQDITQQQIGIAFRAKTDRALTELQNMADSLMETILRRQEK